MAPAARVHLLTKTYGSGPAMVRALDDISLDLYADEFTAVMGASRSTEVEVDAPLHRV